MHVYGNEMQKYSISQNENKLSFSIDMELGDFHTFRKFFYNKNLQKKMHVNGNETQ